MTNTPVGWYDDGHGAMRWWDGARWTEHVQPPAAPVAPIAEPTADPVEPSAAPIAYPAAPVPAPPVPLDAPAGYPGGYAAVPQAGAHPMAPAGPPAPAKGSRGWVLPVILGGVLLVIVILGIVFVPMIVSGMMSAAQTPDEKAAVAAVALYDDAWQEADCEKFEEAATTNLQDQYAFADCDAFIEAAEEWGDTVDDYVVRVTAVETVGDEITVQTEESYTSFLDEDENPVDEGTDVVDHYSYTVVEDDGAWRIHDYGSE